MNRPQTITLSLTRNKTSLRILIILAALLAAALLPLQSRAGDSQRGEKTLGVMGGYASFNDSGYASLYFEYTFASHVRIAPEIGYVFRHNDKSAFTASVDMQFPFRLSRGFHIYPLAGLTFNNWNYASSSNKSRFGGDFGFGFDLYMTQNLKLNLQGKYSLMNDTSGAFVGLGMGYIF